MNKQSEGRYGRLLATGILLGIGAIQPLRAAESAYGLGYTAEYSDNITLVSSNERSGWIHSLLAGFAYQESTTDLVARVLAQATYNQYPKNSFGDETLLDLNSSAVWTISPRRFLWTLEDTARQALIDSTAPELPSNRTTVNVLSTGPDITLRLAPVHTLTFGARAADVYTGRVNADNKRFNGSAEWLYQMSSLTDLSLNYRILDVKFDDAALNNNYTRQDFFFRARYQPSPSRYLLDLGASDLSFDRGNDFRGTLTRLSWSRELTPQSAFGASLSREVSDTGSTVLSIAPPSGSSQTVATGDIYETKSGSIFYNQRGNRIGVQFQAGRDVRDFATIPQDSKGNNGRLQIDYFLSAESTVTLFAYYSRLEYPDLVRRDVIQNSGLRFDHRLTRTVSMGLEGRRSERRSTDSTLEFVDNRALLTLLYSSGPLFTPLRRSSGPLFTPSRGG